MKPEFKAIIVTVIAAVYFGSMFIYEQVAIFTLYCLLFLLACVVLMVMVYYPALEYFQKVGNKPEETQ